MTVARQRGMMIFGLACLGTVLPCCTPSRPAWSIHELRDWPALAPARRTNADDPMVPIHYLPAELYEKAAETQFWAKRTDWILDVAGEPSLFAQGNRGFEAYRCLLLPSFAPQAIVRVLRRDARQSGLCFSKALFWSQATSDFTEVRSIPPAQLHSAQWNGLEEVVNRSGFWTAVVYPGSDLSADGALWVLEGVRGSEYRVVIRENLEAGDSLRGVCLQLLALAGW